MAKKQQRFAVDDTDLQISGWIEAQSSLGMSIHVLIQDYLNRFGATDAYLTVLSRGLGPASSDLSTEKTQSKAPAKAIPAKKKQDDAQTEQKPALAGQEEAPAVRAAAPVEPDTAPPAGFDFSR